MNHRPITPTLVDWTKLVPIDSWLLYREAIEVIRARGLRFAVGGGLAMAYYAQRRRDTKDMDLFVLPRDAAAFTQALEQAGFEDYYDRDPYRRSWIYRGFRDGHILDIIWRMANDRAEVDDAWLTRGPYLAIDNLAIPVVPLEELLWAKLYVLHRDRCDWPDVLNMLNIQAERVDWAHLLDRLAEDRALLSAAMCVFRWLCPRASLIVPPQVWRRLHLGDLPVEPRQTPGHERPYLLDSYHDWFGPDVGDGK